MATHISEAAAAADFPALMARIRQGEEIVIESNSQPLAILRPPPFCVAPFRKASPEPKANAKIRAMNQSWTPTLPPM